MARHLRRVKRIYKNKNSMLIDKLKSVYNNKLQIINSNSGLHIVCQAITSKSHNKLSEDAKKSRILLNIISSKDNKVIFSLNYSGISMDKIEDFTVLLGKVLFA